MLRSSCILLFTAVVLTGSMTTTAVADWPQFRGLGGRGISSTETVPLTWSKESNVSWVREIPGQGWSSPVIVGRRLFLTTAVSRSTTKKPGRGLYGNDYIAELVEAGLSEEEAMERVRARDIEASRELTEDVAWHIFGIDAENGETIWQRRVHRGKPAGGRHRKNTYASETVACDGERVYALFGNLGLFVYSIDGDLIWSKRFEGYRIYLDFGTGASPVVDDQRVYVVRDNEEISTVTAYDKLSGDIDWSVERHRGPRGSGWATPFVWQNDQRRELVTVGPGRVLSYNLEDGSELWRLRGVRGVPAPTPFAAGDLLYVASGGPSEPKRPLLALRAGATGELSLKDEPPAESLAWVAEKGGSYIPTPIVVDDTLYVLYDKGFFAAFDAKTGERHYRVRVARDSGGFTSSPWAHGDKIFCINEDAETFVVQAGRDYKLLGRNPLEETCLATPAVALNSHFIRTEGRLYRVVEKPQRDAPPSTPALEETAPETPSHSETHDGSTEPSRPASAGSV